MDFSSPQKKKKKRNLPKWARSREAAACTGRDLAGQRTGPGPASRACPLGVESGFAGVRLHAGEADPAEAVST